MYCIYKHLNKNGEVIYVGKTNNMKNRQKSHDKEKFWFCEVCKIEYAEVLNKTLMDIYELYYINKFSPKYNIVANRSDNVLSLNLEDLYFINYEYDFKRKAVPQKEPNNLEVKALDDFQSKFIIGYIREDGFRVYCELVYLCSKNELINDKFFKNISGKSLSKYLKFFKRYGLIDYSKKHTLYSVKILNKVYFDNIMDLEEDFYETYYELSNKEWAIYFLSSSYNLKGCECNPCICWVGQNLDSIILNMTNIEYEKYREITLKLKEKYNYNYNSDFEKTFQYKTIKKYVEYNWGNLGYFDTEEEKIAYFSRFDKDYNLTYDLINIEINKYMYLMRGY